MARFYDNMAGTFTELVDGNLNDVMVTEAVSVIVLGTAEQGRTPRPIEVTDKNAARLSFGSSGTLIRGMYEAFQGGAPAVLLYRLGGIPASVAGIGNGGITVTTKEAKADIETEYFIEWADGTLKVWNSTGTKIYEADYASGILTATTDLDEVEVSIDATVSTDDAYDIVGVGANGVAMSELDSSYEASLVLTESDPGTTLTRKELYEELYKAYALLEDYTLHFVVPMDVYLDDFNVADIPSESAGVDPTVYFGTSDYLGYLKTSEDTNGETVFTWADTVVDEDYHEVNFAYQLADFCFGMTRNEKYVYGVINAKRPLDFSAAKVSRWVGKVPTVSELDATLITANGTGLLGNKFMAGTTDWTAGFWATQSGWLDDADILSDRNGVQVDIGRYLAVCVDYPVLYNRFGQIAYNQAGYVAAFAPTYAGILAKLDPKVAPYADALPGTISIRYNVAKYKLDALAGQHFICSKPIPGGWQIYDAPTAARQTSDYRRFTTVNIVKMCDDEIRKIARKYQGVGVTLKTRLALKAELDRRFKDIMDGGYLQRFAFLVTATTQQAVNGQLYIFTELVPAFEARQINNVIGLKAI